MSKKLYRSRKGKMIGGISVGLADYFEIDPVIVRALFIITTIAYGIGIIAYIVLWIIVPMNDFEWDSEFKNESNPEDINMKNLDPDFEESKLTQNNRNDRKLLGGIILISIGFLLFLNLLILDFDFDKIIPIILIIIGGSVLYKHFSQNRRDS